MKAANFVQKPLPRYFFENIVQLENALLIEPNAFDIKSLCVLFQKALEYYSYEGNIVMLNMYQRKLRDLTENELVISLLRAPVNSAIYRERKPDYEELSDRVKQRLKNEKIEPFVLLNEANDIINSFNNTLLSGMEVFSKDFSKQYYLLETQLKLKKNIIKKKKLLAAVDKVTDGFIKKKQSSSGLLCRDIRQSKRRMTFNPSHSSKLLNQRIAQGRIGSIRPLTIKKQDKVSLEGIFGANLLDKMDYLCQGAYESKLNELIESLEKMYDAKLSISLDSIEAMKEIDLMYKDAKEESERLIIEKMKETMKCETNKKSNDLTLKCKEAIDIEKKMISIEELTSNTDFDEITNALFENVLKSIAI